MCGLTPLFIVSRPKAISTHTQFHKITKFLPLFLTPPPKMKNTPITVQWKFLGIDYALLPNREWNQKHKHKKQPWSNVECFAFGCFLCFCFSPPSIYPLPPSPQKKFTSTTYISKKSPTNLLICRTFAEREGFYTTLPPSVTC